MGSVWGSVAKSLIAQLAEGAIGGFERCRDLGITMSQRDKAGFVGAGGQIDTGFEHQMVEAAKRCHVTARHLGEAVDLALTAEEEAEHATHLGGNQRDGVVLGSQLQAAAQALGLVVELRVDPGLLDGLQHGQPCRHGHR